MKFDDVLPHFDGKQVNLAAALGVTKGAVHHWKKSGEIPELHAMRLKYEILPVLEELKRLESLPVMQEIRDLEARLKKAS